MYTVAAYMYVANGAWERSWYCRCQAYVHSASSSLQNGNAFSLHHMWCCALHWRLVLQTAVGSLFSIRRRRVIKGAGGSYPSSPAAVLTLSLSLSLSAEAAISRERDRIGRRWPLMEPRRKQQYHEGCRLDDINKTKAGIPYLNFFYIWVVCPHRACKHLLASLAQVIRVLPHASSLF
jgi:hypothetical protein